MAPLNEKLLRSQNEESERAEGGTVGQNIMFGVFSCGFIVILNGFAVFFGTFEVVS